MIDFIPKQIGSRLAAEKDFRFSPLSGTYNVLIDEPIGAVSTRVVGRRFISTALIKVPAILALAVAAYVPLDVAFQKAIDLRIQRQIETNASDYENLLQQDFRYIHIKRQVDEGQLTRAEALVEVYRLYLAYSQYYQFRMRSSPELSESDNKWLINHILFIHLKPVIESGTAQFKSAPGYRITNPTAGPLDPVRAQQLFKNTHIRYIKYELFTEMIADSKVWRSVLKRPQLAELAISLIQDQFTSELVSLRNSGRITNNQLRLYLQEDAYWQNKFADWQTIDVIRLREENGRFTNEPLRLQDVRNEILAEIRSQNSP